MRDQKRKNLITFALAVFMVVVLAGSAFAFGTGRLTFEGTASVYFSLDVGIVRHRDIAMTEEGIYVEVRRGEESTHSTKSRTLGFTREFRYLGEYAWTYFEFENKGTLPALMLEPSIYPLDRPGFLLIDVDFVDGEPPTLMSGDRGIVRFTFTFDPYACEEAMRNRVAQMNDLAFTITLRYEWARNVTNSVVTPPYVDDDPPYFYFPPQPPETAY